MSCVLGDAELHAILNEDAPYGDLTTRSLAIGACSARMEMFARSEMTLCCSEEAARLIALAGAQVLELLPSGSVLAPGARLLVAQGAAQALHLAWKSAQTLIEYGSGIASYAARMTSELRGAGFDLPLACTRKNFPGTRRVANKAIVCGGAIAHRLGLSETLLVFAEHRVFLPAHGLREAFIALKRRNPEKRLVVEVSSCDEAIECAQAGADVLQLERFSPEDLARCRSILRERGLFPLLAPAGGVTLSNQLAFAQAGADFLVSSAPYFAPPKDVKVVIDMLDDRGEGVCASPLP